MTDREGFLAVFPEGTPPDPSRPGRFIGNPHTWNDGSGRGLGAAERKIADVDFVATLIADLKQGFHADERRIYATGPSNGASMAFRIARKLSHVIAAVAPIAGADWLVAKRPERAVQVLYITGTADPLNPFWPGGKGLLPRRWRGRMLRQSRRPISFGTSSRAGR